MSAIPICLLILTVVAVYWARRLAVTTKIVIDVVLLAALEATLHFWGLSPIPKDLPPSPAGEILRAIAVIWWLIAARTITFVTLVARGRSATSKSASLFSDLLAAAIYVTIAMIVFNSVLGIPVKGLIATSGIVAVVIGLALQNTLSDVFSGIAVGLEQPFHVGDRISLPDLVEGTLVQINWRSIRIQSDGNIAVIPNSVVAKSLITNFSRPSPIRETKIELSAPRTTHSAVTLDLLKQVIMLCPEILASPAPSARLIKLAARTTHYAITFHVRDTDQISRTKGHVLQIVDRLFAHAGIGDAPIPSKQGLLRELALFSSLSDDHLAALAERLEDRTLDTQTPLFEQGSTGASIYIVRAGVIELRKIQDGEAKPQVIARIGPGDTIGQVSMLTGDPRPVEALALTPCEISELPRTAIEALLAGDKKFATALKRAAQRGMDLIGQDHAERDRPPEQSGALLNRLLQFFGNHA